MKKLIKYTMLVTLFLINYSCEDVVDIKVDNAGKRLVIEASIDWEKGTLGNNQTIKLSNSKEYFDDDSNTSIVGASVVVTKDDSGEVFTFADQNDGTYKTANFKPELGKSYTLKVLYNGKEYQANETMIGVPDINKVIQENVDIFGETRKFIEVYFDDNEAEVNFYFGAFSFTGFLPELKVRDDESSNGNENRFRFSKEELKEGDEVNIKFYGISQRYFRYMRLLIEQSGSEGGGSPFEAPPSRLYGNCKNINNIEEEVLGYFRLNQYIETTFTIN